MLFSIIIHGYGHQNSLIFIRQSIANFIEQRGTILNELIKRSNLDFHNYVNALRTPGNYDYVSEDQVMAATEIFKRQIHIYSSTVDVLIFRPYNGTSSKGPLTIAFFESTHYVFFI